MEELFQRTLLALGVPVSKPPAGGQHETYVTFNEVLGEYEAHASNQAQRLYHMVQLHVFSQRDDGTHRALFFRAVAALRAAGVRVRSYGPDDFATTTGHHHMAHHDAVDGNNPFFAFDCVECKR